MKGVSGVTAEDAMMTESADYIHDKPHSKKKVQFTLQYKDGKIVSPHSRDKDGDESNDSVECVSDDDDDDDAEGVNDDSVECEGGDGVEEVGDDSDSESNMESESGDPGVMYSSDLDSEYSEEESNDEPDVEMSKVKQPILKGHSQQEIRKMKEIASLELPYTFTG